VTGTVCTLPFAFPVTVIVNVVLVALRPTVILMFDVVVLVIEVRLRLTETLRSCPASDREIVGEPDVTFAPITTVPELPREIVMLCGVAVSVYAGAGEVTVRLTVVV
jgi:hypothetical protein